MKPTHRVTASSTSAMCDWNDSIITGQVNLVHALDNGLCLYFEKYNKQQVRLLLMADVFSIKRNRCNQKEKSYKSTQHTHSIL